MTVRVNQYTVGYTSGSGVQGRAGDRWSGQIAGIRVIARGLLRKREAGPPPNRTTGMVKTDPLPSAPILTCRTPSAGAGPAARR